MPVLTAVDRCDRCGARAALRVEMITGELMFCAHHAREHHDKLKTVALFIEVDA